MPEAIVNHLPLATSSAEGDAQPASDSLQADPTGGWPPFCTLAELARMLTMLHGHQAPTESSLKKWSAGGEFTNCIAPEPTAAVLSQAPSSFTREALLRRSRGGRPGLRLDTQLAITRVYELWPHLTQSGNQAVLDLAVARAADNLESRLGHLVGSALTPLPPAAPQVAASESSDATTNDLLREVLKQMDSLRAEMADVRREVAQFSSMRNNLITKLDSAIAQTQAVLGAGSRAAGGHDPLIEAQRSRDIGVIKSMLTQLLERAGDK